MEKRTLGKTDLNIAPIVFGGNVFGWTIDEQKSFEILDHFVDGGFDFIDTADVYSRWVPENKGRESETIIGNWLKKRNRRHDVVIATKVGSDMGQGKSLRKDYIINQVEHSLSRLQTDYIDLYFSHFDDETTPVEETLSAYEILIKAGKVRWIGASNFSAERLKESLIFSAQHHIPRYEVYQPGYNLFDREEFEREHEKICLDHDLGVISYYALASGFLTGKYRNEEDLKKSQRGGGVKKFLNDRGFQILDALDQVADKYHVEQASVALAWLIHHPSITAPIASVTDLSQLKSFTAAANLQLMPEDISLLNKASSY
ncbi:aryl-alcohol dehydrogenase-like predicted oxidoreductase [Pedobacter psychrotolerans]|uniref:Aryl-alcohol dehydrogenase-like predicted oxidoreductase n=1 Tax=Pedobacter psychrotolerans TaxID=1843235 RepID=A0A4R2HMK5_9SPHI|nr:aldo/keto reductase [Pedobacter psychrotolerans]TCO31005.1 aryl-alcohol dehydrogenase-like predicted oxidoreductase [Pedobacter psychrotolerans]GGE42879.1 NADP-dependent aryl-alcohol dehydrogenase [Pedobacter psychrotolerans]